MSLIVLVLFSNPLPSPPPTKGIALSGVRTHAPEETATLTQRLGPLGHQCRDGCRLSCPPFPISNSSLTPSSNVSTLHVPHTTHTPHAHTNPTRTPQQQVPMATRTLFTRVSRFINIFVPNFGKIKIVRRSVYCTNFRTKSLFGFEVRLKSRDFLLIC